MRVYVEISVAVTNKTKPENFGGGGCNDDDDDDDDHHHCRRRRRKFKKGAFCQLKNCVNGFSFWQ